MLSVIEADQLKNVKVLERCKSSQGTSCDFWYERLKQPRFSISHLSTCHYRTGTSNFISWTYFQMRLDLTYCNKSCYITFIIPGSLYLLYFASWHYLLISFAFLRYETHGSQDIMNADLQKSKISQSNNFFSISNVLSVNMSWASIRYCLYNYNYLNKTTYQY